MPDAIDGSRQPRNQSFHEIWYGDVTAQMRRKVARCRQCWMVCTARTQLKRQPLAVASWILARQASAIATAALQKVGVAPAESL
jgi:hypothetical protein